MIAVLTYDGPHRKTRDLVLRLWAELVREVVVLALPWTERKHRTPLVPHRPCGGRAIDYARLGYSYQRVDSMADLPGALAAFHADLVLIGGAPVLPPAVLEAGVPILNSHPGYLPYVRGLDALKWAIYEGHPIGCTLHEIEAEPDAGWLVEQAITPLAVTDTFHAFALRHYELEIALLARGAQWEGDRGEALSKERPVHRRMGPAQEALVLERFRAWRRDTEAHPAADWQ